MKLNPGERTSLDPKAEIVPSGPGLEKPTNNHRDLDNLPDSLQYQGLHLFKTDDPWHLIFWLGPCHFEFRIAKSVELQF